ncbi:flavodoxin [Vibrio sp. 10N.261.55.A7]|uniref:flavodoxin n=1 Tax=Vibrio sp. 10N.261.55.A7 TaxID=1880851 RepID=UPI000C829420|nr:flavodoxin [Vibrio sp. 10N.261.55.A7]PMJ89608.1 hypothetical protein BCU12_14120 [Vibrio sp. 10N.261.55.A7]
MSITSLPISDIKNQWLFQHVDVKFPTKESLVGKALYQARLSQAEYRNWSEHKANPVEIFAPDDVYLVDFHRLTVMFSLLQSSWWSDEKEKANVLEFFTQIILSDPCELYVGFIGGKPISAAIVTRSDDTLLVSDFACDHDLISQLNHSIETVRDSFIVDLIERKATTDSADISVYIELM